ncbi:hypothetical protein SAMN02787144_102875 [Streptomyces atratus]|uniref:Uncharacterized protein n=1 Tax=Streptomyces atratus TaxID=1893 RepID=A0A1K2F3J2_STRAR|nr:hypothetical protein SAMN02787144_102875 [Streptomyces atratus]
MFTSLHSERACCGRFVVRGQQTDCRLP